MPIVTVSRQYGSGGSAVAARVASALGWTLYDNAVVDSVAARLGLTHEEVEAREERVPSFVERVTSAMALGVPEVMPMVGDLLSQPTEERLVEVTAMVIEEAVQAGPAVLVGRGAQCMLAARDDALRGRMMAAYGLVVVGLSQCVGAFVGGVVAHLLGVAQAIGISAAVMLAFGMWAFFQRAELRTF